MFQSGRGALRAPSLTFVLAACAVVQPAVAHAEERSAPVESVPLPQAGLKVHVDPKTGKLVETPAPETAGAAPSAENVPAIVMEASPVPGGGVGFRVPDHLRPEIRATTTPDGSAHIGCDAPAK